MLRAYWWRRREIIAIIYVTAHLTAPAWYSIASIASRIELIDCSVRPR